MKIITQKLVARMLRQVADEIENQTCGLSDEEMIEIASYIMHRRVNIEQICEHFGVCRATINRWQQAGKLPPFRKDSGGKDYLFLDEAELAIRKWNQEHPE